MRASNDRRRSAARLRSSAATDRGFTLLEMVVAISIFAVIGAISYTSLDRFLSTRDAIEARNRDIARLQRAFGFFERDIRFMVARPIRDGLGEVVPAFLAGADGMTNDGSLMELTVALPSYQSPDWHRLQRVGWALEDGRLTRRVWQVLDRDFDSVSRDVRLLDGVDSVELTYYTRDAEDGGIDAKSEWEEPMMLPSGVEMVLTVAGGATYRRVVEVSSVPR